MAVWNPKYKYLFLCEPHTGSRSTVEGLLAQARSKEIGHHHIGLPEIRQKGLVPRHQLAKAITFATVRNPYDLLVTRWVFHNKRRDSFADYLRICLAHEVIGGTLFWRTKGVNRYIRQEILGGSLNELLRDCSAPPVRLLRRGITRDKPKWWTLYDKETLDYVTREFEDVERHGYTCYWDDDLGLPVAPNNPWISPHLLRGEDR